MSGAARWCEQDRYACERDGFHHDALSALLLVCEPACPVSRGAPRQMQSFWATRLFQFLADARTAKHFLAVVRAPALVAQIWLSAYRSALPRCRACSGPGLAQ